MLGSKISYLTVTLHDPDPSNVPQLVQALPSQKGEEFQHQRHQVPDEQPNSVTPPTAVGPVVQQAFTEYQQGARPCAGDNYVKDTVFVLKELIVW